MEACENARDRTKQRTLSIVSEGSNNNPLSKEMIMLAPIRNESYKLSIPSTPKQGKKKPPIKGIFRFRGPVRGSKTAILFVEAPHIDEDGTVWPGRKVAMSREDFDLGVDLRKIRGRVKVTK